MNIVGKKKKKKGQNSTMMNVSTLYKIEKSFLGKIFKEYF